MTSKADCFLQKNFHFQFGMVDLDECYKETNMGTNAILGKRFHLSVFQASPERFSFDVPSMC